MAWSPHDSSLLLSSGKDNRTICWDVQSGDIVCELASANWNFDVQVRWTVQSKSVVAVIATMPFKRKQLSDVGARFVVTVVLLLRP
jgi:protein transport protein SEC31